MRLIRSRCVLLVLLAAAAALGQLRVVRSTSTATRFAWGGWNYFPNTGYRYAEAYVTTVFTDSLAHPTYLNVIHQYSQSSGGCVVKAYIATSRQCQINVNTDPHFHTSWWNAASATPGFHVGDFTATPTRQLVSFDVESWISSHPSDYYYLLFDQQDNFADACVDWAWLGPAAGVGVLEPGGLPVAPSEAQCLPNPCAGPAEIRFSLSRPGTVAVRILDPSGRTVRDVCRKDMAAGSRAVTWDGRTDAGLHAVHGTYFYEVLAPGSRCAGKIVLR